jgi:fucose 4-O-acetylase-like acetyltransferase
MALGLAAMAPFALLTTHQRVRWGAAAGAAIALASPLITAADWSALHPFVVRYFVPDNRFFTFFPWAAFVAFGLSAGSIIRLVRADDLHRAMQWATLLGLGLIWTAQYFANLPYSLYAHSDFWLNSPALIFIKLGVLLLLLAVAFLWTRYAATTGWSFVRQLGTTSLLVYWVHTELVYGRWFGEYKLTLSNTQTAAAAGLVIMAMVLLSVARTHANGFPALAALLKRRLGWEPEPLPAPASGD